LPHITLLNQRTDLSEFLLFGYAIGVAALMGLHIPIVTYSAYVLIPFSLTAIGYSLWRLTAPRTRQTTAFFALTAAGIVLLTVLLYRFGTEMAAFNLLEQRNSVTDTASQAYRTALLQLLILHTALSTAITGTFFLVAKAKPYDLLRFFALSWFSLPLLFLLMKLLGKLFLMRVGVVL